MNWLKKLLRSDSLIDIIVYGMLAVFLVIELYPLLYILSASVSDPKAVSSGELILFPIDFGLGGYERIFRYKDIWIGYANTIIYTVLGTILNLAVTLPCAYAFSRKELVGRMQLMILFMITMYIGGGLIPSYLNVKSFGLLNSRIWMILAGAINVYNMIVAKTFFETSIPYEITEAAKIDGCSDTGIFTKIVLPLSKTITAVMILYYGVAHWNSYFDAMIYLDDRKKYPLQLVLKQILIQGKFAQEALTGADISPEDFELLSQMAKEADMIKYGVIVVSTVPMLLIYPKLQKFFEKGVMIGSVKG